MPEEKGIGSRILGLFVEMDGRTGDEGERPAQPGDGEKSAAELVAELAQGSRPVPAPESKPGPPSAPSPQVPLPAGVEPAKVDFDQVFRTAGLDPGELDRVRKAEELLRSLPAATPQDVKRQIVEASLKAFGFDVQKIAGAAQNQLKALDTWVRLNEQGTHKAIGDAQAQIAQLEDRIITLKADITRKAEQLASMSAAAEQRKGEVAKVLQFFAVDAPTPTPRTEP